MTQPTIDMSATPGFSAWLHRYHVSIAFTSYRSSKLITLGCGPDGTLTATDCTLERCMGLGVGVGRLWAASAHQLWRFDNILDNGQEHEGSDAVYMPNSATLTGAIDVHDIAETDEGYPVFVVPRFNCLAALAHAHSFSVLWQPPFISEMVAEDRCHLNGLAMEGGAPRFVTCLADTNESGGWRDRKADGGVVIDVTSNEIVATGLSMPHSPRLHKGDLWLFQSGKGAFGRLDVHTGQFDPVAELPGLPRGLAFVDKWAVIGLSKPRHDSGFDGLPLADRLEQAGQTALCAIIILNMQTGATDYVIEVGPDVEEIYDVAAIHGVGNPRLVDPQSDDARFFIRPKIDLAIKD